MALNLPANWVPSGFKREDGIDFTDAVLAPVFVACSLAMAFVFEIGMVQPAEYSLNYAIWAGSGVDITIAFVLGMAIIFTAWITNGRTTREDLTDLVFVVVLLVIILNILAASSHSLRTLSRCTG
ncbi:hypothetical protein [Natronococcus pandeyae]|nr:hypothetical protein [Natronococcus pandeyae]